MPTVHLICGATGSGKTTYAQALANRVRGVRFSMDEWMALLFLGDRPAELSVNWAVERAARCEAQIWAVAEQLISRGIDVVLDIGLSKRDHRDRYRLRAAQAGAEPKLHYLDVDVEARRQRVRLRNEQRSGPFSFEVTDAMFDYLESAFEAPSDDELYEAMIVCF